MTSIRILDDVYTEKIYSDLQPLLKGYNYPIKESVSNPIPYLVEIKSGDIIVLDNFFLYEGRQQPLGDDFLRQFNKLKYTNKIICISNYGEHTTRFPEWQKAYSNGTILGFAPSKSGDDIAYLIKQYGTKV